MEPYSDILDFAVSTIYKTRAHSSDPTQTRKKGERVQISCNGLDPIGRGAYQDPYHDPLGAIEAY